MSIEMKAVLISIKPKWCELIASGEKTIEIRKNCPNIKTPFKCYIYKTKDGNSRDCGKVIGEFTCRGNDLFNGRPERLKVWTKYIEEKASIPIEDVVNYAKGKDGKIHDIYEWDISFLKIYDKPKNLWSFIRNTRLEKSYVVNA